MIPKSKGKFFWKYEWYSFCGIHREYNEFCRMCNAGSWVNVWKQSISNVIYRLSPNFWRWWMNSKIFKRKL